ncbi:cobalamin biosynthesis protein CbiM [Moorella sp. E308F]|jgi:cobalt/nickel transport system permease protein|uniref:energy-coupling factor ABC transporter permease n=1 Tax=unclassified Neomoorella TaxID=2676739 RepID=UPI0010FFC1B0|nr:MULTISPECIES: energy-coupling factor ABC transporter permease [unclassified Moorella (in: firmicutes)]MDK2894335.1 cobalt/nickel transport system permease protein [Moorella sp. (in: firmicutes)]GEA16443.1 cobalamin biosynthesis protein CbiM [Moorella sp. E308F]GEA17379.1 cobalamin biosynthesis protein CbiM [Moorella sp. E306M]
MSHLHIPDGVIAPAWLVVGYAVTALALALAVRQAGREDLRKKLPRLGFVSAFMLLAMNVPLGLLPVHLNLTVLAGILLGPWLGLVAVFIVNLILALTGHGGITVVGLNTLVVGSEAIMGYYLFFAFRQRFRPVTAAAAATSLALVFSLSLMFATLGLTRIDPVLVFYEDHHEEQVVEASGPDIAAAGNEMHNEPGISLARLLRVVLPISLAGIIVESVVTALIIGYLLKVRPGLIDGPAPPVATE